MSRILRQNVVVLIVVTVFCALSLATGVESAQQTSKKSKTAATPAKKPAKATPTPSKKAQVKEPATTKKSVASAKNKADDKKAINAKSAAKDAARDKKSAKDKNDSKSRQSDSKQTGSTKSNRKTVDKKTDSKTADSKSKKPDTKTAAKNSKSAATAKNFASVAVKAASKTSTAKTAASKSTAKNAPNPAPKAAANQVEKPVADAPQVIVTDISARIRSQAKATAPEVRQAKLGTIFQVTEKTPAWYRVQFVSGVKTSSGWISANSVNDLNSTGKEQIYRQIADRHYKNAGTDFATAAELYEFLTRAAAELGDSNSAELELKKLLALRAAVNDVPAGKADENPYQDFLKAQGKSIVYSEPSGAWLVKSNLFWDLHKKYAKSPLADQIAWEAAQNPLPGECEGYVNCFLFYARMTSGEYLSLHPSGKNNLEALTNLTNTLEPIAASLNEKSVYTGPSDVTDRAEFNNLIAELRTIVSRLPLTEKESPLRQLRQIAEGFR